MTVVFGLGAGVCDEGFDGAVALLVLLLARVTFGGLASFSFRACPGKMV